MKTRFKFKQASKPVSAKKLLDKIELLERELAMRNKQVAKQIEAMIDIEKRWKAAVHAQQKYQLLSIGNGRANKPILTRRGIFASELHT